MPATFTANTQLNKPAIADRHWDVPLNANADYLDGLAAIGGLAVTPTEKPSSSLACRIAAGSYLKADGSIGSFPGIASLTFGPNAASFVWLTDSGTPGTGTSYPASPHVRLAEVRTDANTVVQVIDGRVVCRSVVANPVFVSKSGDVVRGPLQVANPTTGALCIDADPSAAKIGFFGNPAATQAPALNLLVDTTGGAVSDSITSVGSSFTPSTLNNDLASLAAKVNALISAMKRHGLMAN